MKEIEREKERIDKERERAKDKERAYRKNKLFRRIEADIKERERKRVPGNDLK
mgnify:CR=1 FL=1